MKIYKGKIGYIGSGTRTTNALGQGAEMHSIVEIGEHTFRDLWISVYLSNFISKGSEARFGIIGGLGIPKMLLALEIDGKKRKEGWAAIFGLVCTYLYQTAMCGLVGAVVLGILYFALKNLFTPGVYVAIGLLCLVAYRMLSDILGYMRF